MYDYLRQVTSGFTDKAKVFSAQTWLFKAINIHNSMVEELLVKLEKIINIMPSSEKDKLYKKFSDIILDDTQSYMREYDDKFFSVLVEILGWGKLKKYYHRYNPKFTETPDLVIEDDSGKSIAAMECKSIRESDEEKDYFEKRQVEARPVKTSIVSPASRENPFLRKLRDTLCKAEEQLNRVEASHKFIFIHFSWDVSAMLQEEEVKDIIKECANVLKNRGVDFIAFENYRPDEPFINTLSPNKKP